MKKSTLTLLAMSVAVQTHAASQEIVWGEANQSLPQFKKESPFTPRGLLNTIPNADHKDYELKLAKPSSANTQHARYQVLYKGLPVFGHQLIFHKNTGNPPTVTGIQISGIERDISNIDGRLSAMDVEQKILSGLDKPVKFKRTQKVIFIDDKKTAHLAYHLSFYLSKEDKPISAPNYIIDANSGDILKEWNEARNERIGQGLGGNAFPLPYRPGMFQHGDALPNLPSLGKFDVQEILGQCFVQNDSIRVINLENKDLGYEAFPITPEAEDKFDLRAFSYPCSASTLFLNYADGMSGPINYSFSPVNDTMYFAQQTLDMYNNIYGVKKPLGDDLPLRAYTHLGNMDNAFAIPTISKDGVLMAHQQIAIGNGDMFLTAPAQSVIAHELSHNFTELNSELIYDGQTGGINEAFSDMAAIALQDYLRKDYPWYWDGEDWSLGREAVLGGEPLRYMDDPTKDGRSIAHASDYTDSINVHHSSGVFNKAFYLLAHKPGWNVQRAFQVMVDANRRYWSPIAYFDFAACGVIQAAIDRRLDKKPVIEAFSEVGVTCPMHKEA